MLDNVIDGVIADLRKRSKNSIYLTDPEAWVNDVLGKHLWSKQREVAQSVVDNSHTAVVSCNGAGKSALAGMMGAWWIAVHDVYETAMICSAPTYPQIARVLFRELKDNHKLAAERGFPLPGHINQSEEWKLDDAYGTLVAFGRRPADTDIVSAFQGIHRRYVMVILDEAGGIPLDLYTATEAVTNTADARVLAIGNPDRRGTEFHRIFREDPTWNKIKISAYDSPNFTDEVIPDNLRPLLIQKEWVEKRKIAWGEDSARFKSKVLGEFPDEADNTFFSQTAIDKAIDLDVADDMEIDCVLGCDVARFGEDDSVIYINRGGKVRKYATWTKATAIESANRIHQAAMETGAKEVRIDGAGLGGPIVDLVVSLSGDKYITISMMGSAASPDNTRWHNARASNYDNLREMMLDSRIDMDPDDKTLLDEMLMIQYKFTPKGAILMESKDDMRSRGVKSPDSLDALVYATADLSKILNMPYADKQVGDVIAYDFNPLDEANPFYSKWVW